MAQRATAAATDAFLDFDAEWDVAFVKTISPAALDAVSIEDDLRRDPSLYAPASSETLARQAAALSEIAKARGFRATRAARAPAQNTSFYSSDDLGARAAATTAATATATAATTTTTAAAVSGENAAATTATAAAVSGENAATTTAGDAPDAPVSTFGGGRIPWSRALAPRDANPYALLRDASIVTAARAGSVADEVEALLAARAPMRGSALLRELARGGAALVERGARDGTHYCMHRVAGTLHVVNYMDAASDAWLSYFYIDLAPKRRHDDDDDE
jgi:hypothetical protein